MARQWTSEERRAFHEKLLDYAKQGGSMSKARVSLGNKKTVERVWRFGYPEQGLDPVPVCLAQWKAEQERKESLEKIAQLEKDKELYELEIAKLQETKLSKEAAKREQQRLEAEEVREESLALARAAKANAAQLVAVTSNALSGMLEYSEIIHKSFREHAKDKSALSRDDLRKTMELMQRIVRTSKDAHLAAREAVELERLLLDQPTAHVKITGGVRTKVEVQHHISLAQRNMDREKRRAQLEANPIFNGGYVPGALGAPGVLPGPEEVGEEEEPLVEILPPSTSFSQDLGYDQDNDQEVDDGEEGFGSDSD